MSIHQLIKTSRNSKNVLSPRQLEKLDTSYMAFTDRTLRKPMVDRSTQNVLINDSTQKTLKKLNNPSIDDISIDGSIESPNQNQRALQGVILNHQSRIQKLLDIKKHMMDQNSSFDSV